MKTIPKTIFTTWFSEDGSMPELIRRCIESQKIPNYTHEIITLDDLPTDIPYINQALSDPSSKRWTKLSDYVRVYTLYNKGGIYVDADAEILPDRNFDDLLDNQGFCGLDKMGWVGTAIQASVPHNPFYAKWLNTLETGYRGDDGKVELTSFVYLTEQTKLHEPGMTVYGEDYFYPYNFEDSTIEITENTKTIHHFMRSWAK